MNSLSERYIVVVEEKRIPNGIAAAAAAPARLQIGKNNEIIFISIS